MPNDILCTNLNQKFQTESGRLQKEIHERYKTQSVWGTLVRSGNFPLGMGEILTAVTIENIRSSSFEDDWVDVTASSGGVISTACIPQPVEIDFGQTLRTYKPQTKSYRTPCICLSDLKTRWQIEDQIDKTVRSLTNMTKVVSDNRRRAAYAGMVSKLSLTNEASLYTEINAVNGSFPKPTVTLTKSHLDKLRTFLINEGAGENSFGMERGQPTLGLITSPETSDLIIKSEGDVRSDLRWGKPSELLAPLGVDRSFAGYYHMIDLELPRYNCTGTSPNFVWTRVPAQISTTTSNGIMWNPNPAYYTAEFEMSFIFHRDVYEECPIQVGPNIPGASFEDKPEYYNGQFFWLNIQSEDKNPLNLIGRWLAIYQNANKPVNPRLGRAIMHRRVV